MTPAAWRSAGPWLGLTRTAVVVISIAQLALYALLAVRTLAYPYPLEWMEGGTVDVIARIRQGLPLYVQPSAEYVPYIYPPLYYWAGAQVSRVVGVGFLAPRLVSFASVCGVFLLIAAMIRRAGGDWINALAGAALFAGTYEATERWFHVARVDSLFLFLLLLGVYVLQAGTTARSAVTSAVLLWLAFLTKQTTLFVVAAMAPVAAIGAWRRPLITVGLFGALVLATNVVMDASTGGWWRYFLYLLPLMHGPAVHGSYWFWRYDMAPVMGFAIAMTGILLLATLVNREAQWRWAGALAIGGVAASWAARLHSGGAANSLMPAYAGLAIAMPLGVHALGRRPRLRLGGSIVLLLQLALLLHSWTGVMPTAADRAAGDRYVDFLRRVDGEVVIWRQRFVETLAGKRSWGLEMAAEDVLRSDDAATADALKADVVRACRDPKVAGVIDAPDWLRAAMPFGQPVELFDDASAFRTIAGTPKRPTRYYPIR